MSKLYLVPTPIGNLDDMTIRAINILKEADLILAEDTRTSLKLLKHFEIDTRLNSYHKFNEHKKTETVVAKILEGKTIALITDAGTPGISDPGFLLIRECIENNIDVECLPGATAFIPALINSGLPCDRFFFEGFLPLKKGRKARLECLSTLEHTIVLYESPFRLVKTLEHLIEHFGPDRSATVSRELTKIYEETIRGSLSDLFDHFSKKIVKGEIVIVIGGKKS